jgi:hypothetical protein
MEIKSPFSISEEQVIALEHDEGFKVVQAYLSNQKNHSYASIMVVYDLVLVLTGH